MRIDEFSTLLIDPSPLNEPYRPRGATHHRQLLEWLICSAQSCAPPELARINYRATLKRKRALGSIAARIEHTLLLKFGVATIYHKLP
jgi:hypothetical protein